MKSKSLIRLIFVLSVFLPVLTTQVSGDIPAGQRDALIALYNSTNGAGWLNNSNWNGAPGTENTWYGVTCDNANTVVLELDLSGNNLSGVIPTELGNLSNLTYLNLSSNQLTGQIPPELGDLSNLTILNLHSNRLAEIPPELGNLSSLTHLYLEKNEIGVNIPSSFGNLANLERLYLHYNQLTGSIPAGLGSLTNLESLYLRYNNLTGSIPPELGNLENLVDLDLHSNQLTGSIPPELGNLVNLEKLFLHFNRLSGSIPTELENLSNLIMLNLSYNQLTGSIPPELGYLSSLKTLHLFGNQLKGEIPPTMVFLTELLDYTSDLRWNALHTDYEYLRDFLNKKQVIGDWESTQTIAPEGVYARPIDGNSIKVSWTPVTYIKNPGGYRVYYSTIRGGPYELYGTTDNKTVPFMLVTGLVRDTTYYFIVTTQTDPHEFNQNIIRSEYSAEVSARAYDVTISGRVTTALEKGVEGVTLTFSNRGGTAATDANGYYTHTITPGWSGEVTPSKADFSFEPGSRLYENIDSDKPNENYNAISILPVISGRVTISTNTGIKGFPGVKLTFSSSDGESEEITDTNGYYSHIVDFGWTGIVTPSKTGYTFTPSRQPYKDVNFNLSNQDYRATPNPLVISGRVTTAADEGVPDVTLIASGTNEIVTTTTDTNGDYKLTVHYGWSGTITPSKEWYKFNPFSRTYNDISSDQTDEDYIAAEILPVISGRVTISRGTSIEGLSGVSIIFYSDSRGSEIKTTKSDGSYEHEVARGWSGTVTPIKSGYHFNPSSQHYLDVNNDIANQNFTAAKDSVILELDAKREVEGTVAIKKYYGKIELKLIEVKGAYADHYIIYRTSSTGEKKDIEKIPGSDLRRGEPEYYYDRYLEENVKYTYSAIAYDSEGEPLGSAVGKPI